MTSKFEVKDLQTLQVLFPHMFNKPAIGLEFYSGWFPDFVDLCFELDALLGRDRNLFGWVQIKEKFGGYRMYFSLELLDDANDLPIKTFDYLNELRATLLSRIQLAAQRINAKCCVCGQPAVAERHGIWINTLCDHHHPDSRAARGDKRPLHELTAVPLTPADVGDGGRTT